MNISEIIERIIRWNSRFKSPNSPIFIFGCIVFIAFSFLIVRLVSKEDTSFKEQSKKIAEREIKFAQAQQAALERKLKREEEQRRAEESKQLQQISAQSEYTNQIQPIQFVVFPWQNNDGKFDIFVLYDITNKQEYIVVRAGASSQAPLSITPRINTQKKEIHE